MRLLIQNIVFKDILMQTLTKYGLTLQPQEKFKKVVANQAPQFAKQRFPSYH